MEATQTLGKTQTVQLEPHLFLVHMCAQTLGGIRPLYYNHLASCMNAVTEVVEWIENTHPVRICAPAFGSGLAGGNWMFIKELIKDCWLSKDFDVTIYYLEGTLNEEEIK